ncbi:MULTISPECIES: recombinase family protein [unclassified Fusibacter]|uniref:recombinase family protein n=1 Tax=unclassified Fusibacter TaxID=2624464 RepID=UPI0010130829|nr:MULTISPECIES: recombinase family protein [unclassified Fusibacter]MCK8059909.1 recombinase family protein [Fusibacter sp. A2]NPE22051.1 recombinase family protein [Fusibacter sp. A1]RXV60831.1 recombinase family protein [Fusibacter sp. A1]
MKAVGYIRVSTDKIEQEDSQDNQKTLFIQYIKERGFEFGGFYEDVESGTKEERNGLNKLLDHAEDKKFDIIISKELSRLVRNVELAYRIKRIIVNNRIHLITLDGLVDTKDPAKQNMFGLYAWIFEQESVRISTRIKSVFRSKMKEGKFLGSSAPYGYEISKDKSLIIRADSAPLVVKEIFELFLKENSFQGIAKLLTKRKIPTPATVAGKSNAGDFWHGSTIKKILTNPHYIGDLVQAREENISVINRKRIPVAKENQVVVKNTHEPIIDKNTFELVQSILSKRKKKGKGKHKTVTYLYTNYLYCKDCGSALKYLKQRKGYVCGKYHRYGKDICTSHVIKEDVISIRIQNELKALAESINTEDLIQSLQAIEKGNSKRFNEVKQLERAIKSNLLKKEKLLDLLLSSTIDEDIYHLKMNKLKKESLAYEENLLQLKSQSKDDIYSHERLIKEITEIKSFDTINRNVLQKFIDKVIVNEDSTFSIQYNFKL